MRILGPPSLRIPTGVSDYAEVRRDGYTYVDKTAVICDVLERPGKVKLIPRPRRFGKTLNLSTMRYFFESSGDNHEGLFADTEIWELDEGSYRAHFQRYPVIALSFKDVKATAWSSCWEEARGAIQSEVRRLWSVHGLAEYFSGNVPVQDRYAAITDPAAERYVIASSLEQVSAWLATATGERAVVLIDEYDAPLHAAWHHGYWDEAIDFFRRVLSGVFKDNPNLFRGVMTGILRVAKENIFSGLNNVETYSILNDPMSSAFGFTQVEVDGLAGRADATEHLPDFRAWYNGYRFGYAEPVTVYNPWSLLKAVAEPSAGMRGYWKNTSSNALVREQLMRHAAVAGSAIESLIVGEAIATTIDDNVALSDVSDSAGAMWSLLTFSGYLTPVSVETSHAGFRASLRIPNREVESIFRTTFADLLALGGTTGQTTHALTSAMLSGDARAFERGLGETLKTAMSVFDFGPRAIEAVYQAFIIGLLVHLEPTHAVRSNRESGFGRADVLITPRQSGSGAVLELKVIDTDYEETRESALEAAVEQIRDREYAAEVLAAGATAVHQYAVVFNGKRAWVEMVPSA